MVVTVFHEVIFGGAGIGAGAGLLVHWARELSEGGQPEKPITTANSAYRAAPE